MMKFSLALISIFAMSLFEVQVVHAGFMGHAARRAANVRVMKSGILPSMRAEVRRTYVPPVSVSKECAQCEGCKKATFCPAMDKILERMGAPARSTTGEVKIGADTESFQRLESEGPSKSAEEEDRIAADQTEVRRAILVFGKMRRAPYISATKQKKDLRELGELLMLFREEGSLDRVWENGETFLTYAVQKSTPEVVKLLLKKGASLSPTNKYRFSASNLAEKSARPGILEGIEDILGPPRL